MAVFLIAYVVPLPWQVFLFDWIPGWDGLPLKQQNTECLVRQALPRAPVENLPNSFWKRHTNPRRQSLGQHAEPRKDGSQKRPGISAAAGVAR